jgi:hypothetical protein
MPFTAPICREKTTGSRDIDARLMLRILVLEHIEKPLNGMSGQKRDIPFSCLKSEQESVHSRPAAFGRAAFPHSHEEGDRQ